MDIRFLDNENDPLPPDKIQLEKVEAEYISRKRRIKIIIAITPFLKPPNLEIMAFDPDGNKVASAIIIEAVEPIMSLNLHLKGEIQAREYRLRVILGYPESDPRDQVDLMVRESEEENTV
jgi:hypothetical protein